MSTTIEPPVSGQDGENNFPVNGVEPPMSECLTTILRSLKTMKDGDFSVRLPVSWTGLPGKIADNFNEIVTANEQMAFELKRVGQAVGKEGKTRERIRVEHGRGACRTNCVPHSTVFWSLANNSRKTRTARSIRNRLNSLAPSTAQELIC